MKSNTLGLLIAGGAAIQFVTGFGGLTDLVGKTGSTWVQLVCGAATVFLGVYVARQATTPADTKGTPTDQRESTKV